jgi:hypothetical protein
MLAGWPNNIIHDQACITWSARGCRRFGLEIVRLLPMHFQANRTLPFAKPTKTSTARGGENLLEGTSWIVVEFYAMHYAITEWPNAERLAASDGNTRTRDRDLLLQCGRDAPWV